MVKKKGMDPLLSDTWYKITAESLYETKVIQHEEKPEGEGGKQKKKKEMKH